MQPVTFNYREQLVNIYWHLDDTVGDLFNMAFEIGLEEEWQDLRDSLKDDDIFPIKLEYLQTIEHKTVPGLIEMARILWEAHETLRNINHLTEDELYLDDDEEEEEEIGVEDKVEEEVIKNPGWKKEHYLDKWMEIIPLDFLDVYDGIATLALEDEPSKEMYDRFFDELYGGKVELESGDYNVYFLLEALNKVLKIMGETEFYV